MTPSEIYNALNPAWWVQQPSLWSTDFVSTTILFDTSDLSNCEYISSAPIQTNGLSSGSDAPASELDTFIDNLRTEAAQRLFDMKCTNVVGHRNLSYVYGASN